MLDIYLLYINKCMTGVVEEWIEKKCYIKKFEKILDEYFINLKDVNSI